VIPRTQAFDKSCSHIARYCILLFIDRWLQMKRLEGIIKTFVFVVFIIFFVLTGLILHDLWITLGEADSKDLFFPKLFENNCFQTAFNTNIKDEKIIYFNCSEEAWGGNRWYSEIVMFCNEECFSSKDIFKYPMDIQRKQIEEIEKEFQAQEFPQYDFIFFKKTLENEYYKRNQKPLTEAIISHFHYESSNWDKEILWYDYNSKICWYITDQGH